MKINSKASFDALFNHLPADGSWQTTDTGRARRVQDGIELWPTGGDKHTVQREALTSDTRGALQAPSAQPSHVAGSSTARPTLPTALRLREEVDGLALQNGGRGQLERTGTPGTGCVVHVGIYHASSVEGSAPADPALLVRCNVEVLKRLFAITKDKNHLTLFMEGRPNDRIETVTPQDVKGARKIFESFSFLTDRYSDAQFKELQNTHRLPYMFAYLAQIPVTIRGTEDPNAPHMQLQGKATQAWLDANKGVIDRGRDAFVTNDVLKGFFAEHPHEEAVLVIGAAHHFGSNVGTQPGQLDASLYYVDASHRDDAQRLEHHNAIYDVRSGFDSDSDSD